MYKRIMVAVDDTFAKSNVLDTAISLAKQSNARLAVCHALDETIFARRQAEVLLPGTLAQVTQSLSDGARQFLDQAAAVVRAAGLEVDVRVVQSEASHVAEMLAEAAAEWQADLLVLGSHGQRGIDRFFVGSLAEQLVRKARTSLLLVRSD